MNWQKKVALGIAWGASLAAGVAAGYVYADRKLRKEYDEKLQQELDASVNYLQKRGKAEPTEEYQERRSSKVDISKPPLEEFVAERNRTAYHTIMTNEGYSPETPQEDDPSDKVITQSSDEIYAIPTDVFLDNESGYDQCSISYFADGGVLDEHGDYVVDFENMIGTDYPPFGELSGEPHIVYLRNTRLRMEIEVVKDDDNAADILAANLEHQSKHPGSP